MPLFSWQSCFTASIFVGTATAFTGSEYQLSHEYSGINFFDGWDFFSGRDPTGGFVTYYSRSSAQLTDLISASEDGPAYMGVNYVDTLPFDNSTGRGDGAGRPSVRIASKQAFTHGLFIGDFDHIPAGICGTWPAFWTLGPNWPYTGEVDILEGVNQNMNNVMSLHTNGTCTITGNASVMTGQLENTDCAYYPDYNVGCGVSDSRETSFGVGFNQAGGGVYAMQWTSESILIWHWPRSEVPGDIDNKTPDPGSWGLPVAQLAVGNCSVDQHFQSHKIIFDTTFCGEYAGNPFVWKTDNDNSCADATGLSTCDNYVANSPAAFKDAYWSVNYVRVYQLVDPGTTAIATSYIASEQPANIATNAYTATPVVPTPNLDADALCPKYNYTVISDGKYQYEIACDVDPPGPDLAPPYPSFTAKSLADCIKGCTYINENNGANKCGGVSHFAEINFCYFKKYIDGTPTYRKGYNEVRLIYYGYPQVTDDPRSMADSTLTSVFIETIPTPQTYRPTTSTTSRTVTSTTADSSTTSFSITLPPAMGDNSTSTSSSSGIGSDYSETVTQSYGNGTSTTLSPPTSVTSTDSEVTNADFYIVFNVGTSAKRLATKRSVQYLGFDSEGQSILVDSEVEASKFHVNDDGTLKSGSQFVAIDSNAEPPRFLLQDTAPDQPVTVNVDGSGNVSLADVQDYCLLEGGTLAVVESGETPTECQPVEPELLAAQDNSTTSTTTPISRTSMESPSTTTSENLSETTSNTRSTTLSTPSAGGITTTPSRSSTRSTSNNSTTSSRNQPQTSSAETPLPTGLTINGFAYAGCFGVPAIAASLPGINLPTTDDFMTIEKCTKQCKDLNAYYAGVHEKQCFCGTNVELYDALLDYPDASCNTPCPGANREMCGGNVLFEGAVPMTLSGPRSLSRRQADLLLISLYNNTLLLPQNDESDGPTDTDTTMATLTNGPTGPTDIGFFPTESISYNITGTNTATIISTTYVDVCPVCPGGLTTKATTITVPHCGCTASYDHIAQSSVPVPSPSVPMTTTIKECACGHEGARSTIIVTVPHETSIQQLASIANQFAVPVPEPTGTGAAPAMGTSAGNAVQAQPQNAGVAAQAAQSGMGSSVGMTAPVQSESAMPANANLNMNANNGPIPVEAGANAAMAGPVGLGTTPSQTAGALNSASNSNTAAYASPPAPASPPSLGGTSNTAAPVVGNLSTPAQSSLASNGSLPPLIQSYTASTGSTFWLESRYMISLVIGAFLAGIVVAW